VRSGVTVSTTRREARLVKNEIRGLVIPGSAQTEIRTLFFRNLESFKATNGLNALWDSLSFHVSMPEYNYWDEQPTGSKRSMANPEKFSYGARSYTISTTLEALSEVPFRLLFFLLAALGLRA
jgi:hypothetical protein